MSPTGGGEPSGELLQAIEVSFHGARTPSKKEFGEKAVGLFGSGWAWLASDAAGKLEILPLGNADTPLKHGKEPALSAWTFGSTPTTSTIATSGRSSSTALGNKGQLGSLPRNPTPSGRRNRLAAKKNEGGSSERAPPDFTQQWWGSLRSTHPTI